MQRHPVIPVMPVSASRNMHETNSLKIGGVTPFTATDFPGKLSAVVFVQGCPWSCGYCHNTHLQPRTQQSQHAWRQVRDLLLRRRGLIDAVVFSGGEPTIDPALPQAIADVRDMGFEIGMHSAGIYPDKLAAVLPHIDWIGLDIKAPFAVYERITGVAGSGEPARDCLRHMLNSGIAHEARTTVHPGLLTEEEIADMAWNLSQAGVRTYALQVFRKQGCADARLNAVHLSDYPSPHLIRYLASLFPQFSLRRA